MSQEESFLKALRETAALSLVGPEAAGREKLIRLLNMKGDETKYQRILDSLCIRFGLFPYLSSSMEELTAGEAISVEFHRSGEGEYPLLHSEQSAVLNRLLDGNNVVLSAPTSFGKTKILESLLLEKDDWAVVVVIVPTIALMDELDRRLSKNVPQYKIVTHTSQEPGEKTLYLLTQERFLDLDLNDDVDFFMIDEFYHLSAEKLDSRAIALNIAWKKLQETGAQFYLAGPYVKSFTKDVSAELKESFYYSDFKTVAVDFIDRSFVEDSQRLGDLLEQVTTLAGPTLVFVSAVNRAVDVAIKIGQSSPLAPNQEIINHFADWLVTHFTADWKVSKAVRTGVGVHYGSLPRGVQHVMVRLFDSGDLRFLCCTSTLIQGVNTNAENIVIYDKSISRKQIDFFTFNNIAGRAGRMGKHYVGKVISYMPRPEPHEVTVDVPIESQPDDAPGSLLVQIESSERKPSTQEKLDQYYESPILPFWLIRKNSGYSPEQQLEVAKTLIEDSHKLTLMQWTGIPTWEQKDLFFDLILQLLSADQRRGMNTKKALGMLEACRKHSYDLVSLIRHQEKFRRPDQGTSEVIDDILSFQRNWMGFRIGSAGIVLERIVDYLSPDGIEVNYSKYLSDIENLFLPPNLALLDEQGLPLPLIQKMAKMGLGGANGLDEMLEQTYRFCNTHLGDFTEFELWIVKDWMAKYRHRNH